MSIISAGTSNTTSLVYTGDTTGAMVFQTNGTTEAMRITSGQNVGIGTNVPTVKLDIAGSLKVTNSSGSSIVANRTSNPGSVEIQHSGVQTAQLSAVSGGGLEFYQGSSPTLVMKYDSAGRVTMPYQPAFHAVRTGGNVSSTGIFICNTVTYNDGNHYNSSTGRFTAPVAGSYQMNFFVLAQNGNNFDFAIRVNGSQYPGMDIRCNSGAIGGNFTLSCSAIFKLSANDIVDPFISSYVSGPIYGLGLNGFSMYLLG